MIQIEKVRKLWAPITRKELMLMLVFTAVAMTLMIAAVQQSFAQSETLSLEIDPTPLFNSIETYVPLFFGILAVAGGILIGKRIAMFVIDAIAEAF